MLDQAIAWASANPVVAVTVVAVSAFLFLNSFTKGHGQVTKNQSLFSLNKAHKHDTGAQATSYTALHDVGGGSVDDRKDGYAEVVNSYYDLVTDMYLFGWGASFHFATRFADETFDESIRRHEYYLVSKLNVSPGKRVLDVGCGVGGPARNIAKFADVHVTGLTLNQYQVDRGNAICASEGLAHKVELVQGNFMDIQLEAEQFDAAYAIEATCHAPDRTKCFSEVFKVLKPGATFAGYEWVFTDKYDPSNAEHAAIMRGIEVGDGLPDTTGADDVINALRGAGFEVKECRDLAPTSQLPWYQPFLPEYTVSGFRTTPIGIYLTSLAVGFMEMVGIAPKGTGEMHKHLATAGVTLSKSGELGIFTPMLHFVAVKPEEGKADKDRDVRSRSRGRK